MFVFRIVEELLSALASRWRTARTLCFIAGLTAAATMPAFGRDIGLFRFVTGAKMVSGGVGALRASGSGTITISGIPSGSNIGAAYLYWHGPTNSLDPSVNANVMVNSHAVIGTNIGFSSDNCWGFTNSQAYRADITSLVSGNGSYVLSGLASGYFAPATSTPATTNGASIVVFYTDGDTANYRDFALLDGNDSNVNNAYDAPGWTVTVSGINYSGTGAANLWLHVSDGQAFPDAALVVNGVTIVPAGPIFQGDSVPPSPPDPNTSGNLWDIKSFNVQPELTAGLNTLTLTTGFNSDCLSDIADVYDLPAGSATTVPGLALAPATGTDAVGQSHTVSATATLNGSPSGSDIVSFSVNGANTTSGSCTTDTTGRCSFTYSGTNAGKDLISAKTTISGTPVNATPVTETWVTGGTLTLSPSSATNVVGQVHVVTATATVNNVAAQNITVTFVVTGANPTNGSCITGTNGTCPFSYTGIFAGTDLITASATIGDSSLQATANKIWLPSQSQSKTFTTSTTPETKIYTVGQPTDPAAQSLALTVATVIHPIIVTVEFHYEPTELLTEHNGLGVADGICERSSGATEFTDFDCRLADGGFVYQTLANGDQVVPHIIPSHNNFGVWIRVIATLVSNGQPAVAGTDYTGPVEWYYAWNTNPPLIPSPILEAPVSTASTTNFVNPEYAPGWNNLNPQIFDRHGDDPDIAFKFNITTYTKFSCNPTCVGTNDPGIGGKTPTFNDVVAADIPNPPTGQADVVEPVVPNPSISPFPYAAGFPMLVAFELEKTGTETPDTTAVTFPHHVSAAVLDPITGLPITVPTFPGFPLPGFPTTFTYNPFFKFYYIFLSPTPLTPGKTYQLQINSDLFPKPVNANIVVRKPSF